jgi:hypothetical protein
MLPLLTRSPKRRTPHLKTRARLGVEQLEMRDCPSMLSMLSFGATPLNSGHLVDLHGQIADSNPSAVVVSFTGVAAGSVHPGANGFFDLQTNASSLGLVNASAVDTDGSQSGAAAQLTASAPSLMVNITYGANKQVTLSGMVMDGQPGGMTVTFTGVATGTVTTNANGSFSTTLTATALGKITAKAQDVWGLNSNAVDLWVSDAGPTITLKASQTTNGVWVFTGKVTDFYAPGLTVTFSSSTCTAIDGKTATVQADGTFTLAVVLNPGDTGWVRASVADCWNESAAACFDLP